MAGETHYIYDISGGEDSSIHDGDTDNTVTYDPGLGTGTITVDVYPGDYVEWIYPYYQSDDPALPSQYSWFDLTPYYVYTANNVWKYAGNSETNNPAECGYQNYYDTSYCIATDSEDNEIIEGSTGTEIKLAARQDAGDLIRAPLLNSNSTYYHYTGSVVLPFADPDNYGTIQYLTGTVTVQPKYGDVLTDQINYVLRYQYPGVWVDDNNYPDLTISPEPPVVDNWKNLDYPYLGILDYDSYSPIGNGDCFGGNDFPTNTITNTNGIWISFSASQLPINQEYNFENNYKLTFLIETNGDHNYKWTFECYEGDTLLITKTENLIGFYKKDGNYTDTADIGIYASVYESTHQAILSTIVGTSQNSNNNNRLILGGSAKGWYSNAALENNNVYKFVTSAFKAPKGHVQLKWTDPPDLPDWDPYPCTWEGTVIVRKEDSPPLHRWDGEKVVRTTTRDKYKTEPYKDEDIVSGKTYYYAFMPYYTRYDDPDHPIRFYTFTKVIKVEIGDKSLSSTIDSIDVDGIDATINYTLSQPDGGSFTSIKMYGKIGKNPKCDNTDDVVEDVDSSVTSLTLTGLESGSTYYFCLVTMDTNNKKLSSNVVSCYPFDPVPEEYKSYVNKLNSTTWGTSDTYTLLQYSNRRGNSNTWVLDDIYAYTTRDNFNNNSNCYDLIVLSECNIVVTSNNNSVTVNYNYTVAPHDVIQTSGRDMWGTYSQSGNHGDYIQTWGDRSGINFYGQYNVDTITFSLTTSFNSLTDCMSYLTQHFRRINSLKVDGYDWIKK